MKSCVEIDKGTFEDCCRNFLTREQTAKVCGTSANTLLKWCRRTYSMDYSSVKASLAKDRYIEFMQAGINLAHHNPAVWIFLAKNILGFSDQGIKDNPVDVLGESALATALKKASRIVKPDESEVSRYEEERDETEEVDDGE